MTASSPLRSLSIVLPCHDEADSVESVVRSAVRVGRRVATRLEVIVVDDGSQDTSSVIVAALGKELPEVKLVQHERNCGYGVALRTGFAESRMDWVFYTDADGQFDVDQVNRLLPLLQRADIVTGFRIQRMDGRTRWLMGRMWTTLVNASLGLGVRDVNCAFKIYPRKLFEHIELRSRGAAIDAEVLAQAHDLGLRIAEAGVDHRPRRAGRQSGASLEVALRGILELGRLAWRWRRGGRWTRETLALRAR